VAAQARELLKDVQVELVDLADYALPFFNEPASPQFNPQRQPEAAVQAWLDKVAEADGYVVVSPEYNRSYPAVLKNALDFLDFQWAGKPVALVGHGSVGGAHAVVHLRSALAGVQAISVPNATFVIGMAGQLFADDGTPKTDVTGIARSLARTLEGLATCARALKSAR
jgi:NAD(P)H-dependent FMN reductase